MCDRKSSLEQYDDKLHYHCPMLGGEVPFRYCRTLNEGKPCRRIETCWEQLPDIGDFLDSHYDMDELRALWSRPRKDKFVTLFELLQKARKEP